MRSATWRARDRRLHNTAAGEAGNTVPLPRGNTRPPPPDTREDARMDDIDLLRTRAARLRAELHEINSRLREHEAAHYDGPVRPYMSKGWADH